MASTIIPFRSPSSQPTRQTALAQLATSATVASVPGATLAADPFPELERRFWHYYRWEGLPRDMEEDDPRIEAYSDRWQTAAAAIIATPAMSMVGIGTKV